MAELLGVDRLLRCNQVDCRPPVVTPPRLRQPGPLVDYMAKDYDSLLRVLLDQLPSRVPGWRDRSEADLGMAILELFAYVGDQLSYYQDRVAAEGYLRTATQYESVRKLLGLIDYRLDPGTAATAILRYDVTAPTFVPAGHRVTTDSVAGRRVVFETSADATLDPALNQNALAANAPANTERTEARLPVIGAGVLGAGAWLFFGAAGSGEWAQVAEVTVGVQTVVTLTRPLRGDYPAGAPVLGNGVPATHGERFEERVAGTGLPSQRHELERAPITYTDGADGVPTSSLSVEVDGVAWREVEDFVDSTPSDSHYRVARDNAGFATIEFGDGQFGRVPPLPPPGALPNIVLRYRIGLGDPGMVAAGAITNFDPIGASIRGVSNPLPSAGARAPQPLSEARLVAPQLARRQQRAVTADDYARVLLEGVRVGGEIVRPLHARASMRWTGSWTTVFVSVDPPGRLPLSATPQLREALEARIAERRLAGVDVALRDAAYVPLHIALVVNVRDGFFARLVRQAVERALGTGDAKPGVAAFFAPRQFGFGDAVYLSDLYGAVMAVEGVASVQVTRFKQLGDRFPDSEQAGFIPVGPLAIARMDNDPAHPEHGVLFIRTCGGKEG
jgi:hypothetical protein